MTLPDIVDPAFDTLRWDARSRIYEGELRRADGTELLLGFDPDDGDGDVRAAIMEAMLPAARESLRWVLQQDARVRRAMADRSIDDYNRYGRDPEEDPEPISADEFAGRLRLLWCWFFPGGRVEMGYDDAFMFGGHKIRVECRPAIDVITLLD